MTPQRRAKLENALKHRQPDLVVVLENVHDPHNIMAVFRSCDAVGVQQIGIVHSNSEALPEKWQSKSAASAEKWIDVTVYNDILTCCQRLKKEGFLIYTTHLKSPSTPLHQVDFKQKIALVFGNERDGISDEALSLSSGNITIPQVGIVQSLNISVACAVTLYEAYRQRRQAGFYQQQRLNTDEYNAIFERWSS